MNRIIFILIATLLTPILLMGQQELKQQGDEAYRTENYQQAIEYYESILRQGKESHEVYYNLGCSYFRMNELGLAIVNFERALQMKPTDHDTQENLALCYNMTQDHIQQLPQPLIASWWHKLVHLMTPQKWYGLLLLVQLLLCIMVAWFLLSCEIHQRRATLIASLLTGLLTIAIAGCSIQASHDRNSRKDAIVMRPMVSVRVSPDNNSNDKFTLHEGTKVTVEENLDEWCRIRIADGNNGWIASNLIERI
ncbi:MAG: tetratricopeptide repeat protein [Bacteroidales bacterium]|nr:tetratricopeptide repeat protein [Bacteroidales bacterium]